MQNTTWVLVINIALFIPETLLSGWLARGAIGRFLAPKPGKIRMFCVVVLLGFFASTWTPIGDIVNAVGTLLTLFSAVFFFYNGSILSRVFVYALIYAVVTSGKTLIDALIMNDTQYYIFLALCTALALTLSQTKWWRRLVHMLGALAITILVHSWNIITSGVDFPTPYIWLVYILLLFSRKVVQKAEGETLPPRLWGLLNMLALPPFASVLVILLWGGWLYGKGEAFYMSHPQMMVMGFSALSAVAVFAAAAVLMRHHAQARERELLQARESYYEQIEQSQQQIRVLRHDMANHLNVLANLPADEASAYLSQLMDSPAISGGARFCENETANTILTVKAAQMRENNIQSRLDVVLSNQLGISAVDLCALFANLLDNALEACKQLPEEERLIQLSAKADKGLFVLKVENSFNGVVTEKHGKLQTSKKDKANHGLGLAGVKDIARRYGGEVSVKHENGRFVCIAHLAV
jgi:hypothetical protein